MPGVSYQALSTVKVTPAPTGGEEESDTICWWPLTKCVVFIAEAIRKEKRAPSFKVEVIYGQVCY